MKNEKTVFSIGYLGMMFIPYLIHGDLINKKKDTNKKLNTYKKIRDIELNNHTHKSKYIKRKVLIKN